MVERQCVASCKPKQGVSWLLCHPELAAAQAPAAFHQLSGRASTCALSAEQTRRSSCTGASEQLLICASGAVSKRTVSSLRARVRITACHTGARWHRSMRTIAIAALLVPEAETDLFWSSCSLVQGFELCRVCAGHRALCRQGELKTAQSCGQHGHLRPLHTPAHAPNKMLQQTDSQNGQVPQVCRDACGAGPTHGDARAVCAPGEAGALTKLPLSQVCCKH